MDLNYAKAEPEILRLKDLETGTCFAKAGEDEEDFDTCGAFPVYMVVDISKVLNAKVPKGDSLVLDLQSDIVSRMSGETEVRVVKVEATVHD